MPRRGLRKITYIDLFDSSSGVIILDPTRPTVLTGSNGSGKSTLLRLVGAASNGDLPTLASAPVGHLILEFHDIPTFHLRRESPHGEVRVQWGQNYAHFAIGNLLTDLPDWALQAIEDRGFDIESARDDLIESAQAAGAPVHEWRFVRDHLATIRNDTPALETPAWFEEFSKAFPVLSVSDQRLVTQPRGRKNKYGSAPIRTRLAVESASADIAQRLSNADTEYARASQQVDRQLPQYLLEAMANPNSRVTDSDVSELLNLTEERREKLRRVGIMDISSEFDSHLSRDLIRNESIRRVIRVVLESNQRKLDVLSDLERRLTAFKSFLDDRFAPKVAILSRAEGIRFELPDGQRIHPRQLSSGEQQMTVLAYEILFNAKPDTLIVIDEPEISLHVLWQDSLIEDLSRMGSPSNAQFLMATHSPGILAEYPELERPLSRSFEEIW